MAALKVRTLRAENPGAFTLDGTRTYILNEEIVIDPGPLIDEHIGAIRVAAPRLQAIVITHRHGDHVPAAEPLKDQTGAIICAPPGVLDGVADQVLRDSAMIQIGSVRLEAVATPGHTPEHFCFLTPSGDLFSGDAILGEGTTIVEGNMREYIESLRHLRSRAPKKIYPGHGPIRSDAVQWIDYYLAHRAEREAQIIAAMESGARQPPEVRAAVYPNLDPRLHAAAEMQIRAHQEMLTEQGRLPE